MRNQIYLPLVVAVLLFAFGPARSSSLFSGPESSLTRPDSHQDDTFSLGEGRFEISGRKPARFSEFRYLYLEGALLKASPGRRLITQPPGTVRGELYGRQKFRIRNGRFEGEFLSFETTQTRGVSFQFRGKVSNYSSDDTGVIQPQFQGTLSKYVRGKKTAETDVIFIWLEPEF